jgi:hypothetical protein
MSPPATARAVATALATILVAACGGSSSKGPEATVVLTACNPVAQSGCSAAKKCTWIATGPATGALGCAPAGAATEGQACAYGPDGVQTGFDDCAGGLACISGTCKPLCDLAAAGACGAAGVCQRYSGFYDSGGTQVAGACEPTCDPVTQVRSTDGAAACGSANPTDPSRGCFGLPAGAGTASVFTCAPTLAGAPGHGTVLPPPVFLNGCAPGALPILAASNNSSDVLCVALCTPAPSSSADFTSIGGLAPHTCADRGAAGAECRYWWFLEHPAALPSPARNGVGFCFEPSRYTWDDDGNAFTPEVPLPSCAVLEPVDTNGVATDDAAYWGCLPLP